MAFARCVGVAFSGGRDSTALLHATLRQAQALGVHVAALHVHHGLQAQADAWVTALRRRCARWARDGAPLSFAVRRLTGRPQPGESVEAWARRERYLALGEMAREAGATLVLLGHHRRDQAETLLLQALRGGGASALAAMPRTAQRAGITWARPWLAMPRSAIEGYVTTHRLRYIDDESNGDPRFARNRLRLAVWPALATAFPEAEAALHRAAQRAQQEAACLAELAHDDLARVSEGDHLALDAWAALSPARRANSLRAWLRARCGRGAVDSLVDRLLDELPRARSPARWPASGGEVRRYRGLAQWCPHAPNPAVTPEQHIAITKPGSYPLPAWHAVLHVHVVDEGGVALQRLLDARLAPRCGGEQFQRGARGVPRALKKQYQAAGRPAWERSAPLLYCGDQLAFVPGLGLDGRMLAAPGTVQVALRWESKPDGISSGNP